MKGSVIHMDNRTKSFIVHAMLIVPAVALGVMGMILAGVRPMMWGQQIAACFIFALLALVLRRAARKLSSAVWMAAIWLLLAATLLGAQVGGARRWLDLGLFHVNAAMLVLPAMFVLLGYAKSVFLPVLCTAAVLSIQPDFSQLTAFAAASLPILWHGREKRIWKLSGTAALTVLLILCMRMPTAMEPAAYTEGILLMLGESSRLLVAAGALSLVLIPAYCLWCFWKRKNRWMLSLAVYYAAVIAFGVSGAYPVPFMGFGLSPIAGYWLIYLLAPDAGD